MTGPNVFNIHGIGDKGFNKELYFPSRFYFTSINNNLKLALYHINLQEYREYVAVATKTNNMFTCKVVCFACFSNSEFHLVTTCGLEVIKYLDHVGSIGILLRS